MLVDHFEINRTKEYIELDSLDSEMLSNILDISSTQKDMFEICLMYVNDNNFQIKGFNDFNKLILNIKDLSEAKQVPRQYGSFSVNRLNTFFRKITIFDNTDSEDLDIVVLTS